jgi:bifunctional DNA-binding transcriptional regulator/antitoxin component of YhaV-PrlF toxin-antitoxin module
MKVSYKERVPIIEAVLRRLGGPATVAELYTELKDDLKFGTSRRIAATFRYDQRQPQPVFVREGKNLIALRNPAARTHRAELEPQESRVYDRGQTVVPKTIRDAMRVEEGTTLVWQVEEGVAQVMAIPKDPIGALYGIMKDKGPTFQEYLAERNAERERERKLEARD